MKSQGPGGMESYAASDREESSIRKRTGDRKFELVLAVASSQPPQRAPDSGASARDSGRASSSTVKHPEGKDGETGADSRTGSAGRSRSTENQVPAGSAKEGSARMDRTGSPRLQEGFSQRVADLAREAQLTALSRSTVLSEGDVSASHVTGSPPGASSDLRSSKAGEGAIEHTQNQSDVNGNQGETSGPNQPGFVRVDAARPSFRAVAGEAESGDPRAPAQADRPQSANQEAASLRPPTQVTVPFSGEDGLAGHLRVSLHGPALRAVISANDTEAVQRIVDRMDELHRNLKDRGFSETHVSVRRIGRKTSAARR